jgi:hypothetical protein
MDSADWPRSYHRGGAVKLQVTVEHCPPGRIQLGDRVQLTHNEMHAVSALVSDPASPGVIYHDVPCIRAQDALASCLLHC